jgi:ubiquinone/menaquinone biosynthesis C-methylase UbiE
MRGGPWRAIISAAEGTPTLEELLAEQIDYYNARAAEYDEVFAGGEGTLAPDGPVARTLRTLADGRDVLELACGTGHWSAILARHAASLTALDAAPGMLSMHARRLSGARVRRICADAYASCPDRRYDLVFCGFLLAHAPDDRLGALWRVLDAALAPDGVVAFCDTDESEIGIERPLAGAGAPAVVRRLADGREFRDRQGLPLGR